MNEILLALLVAAAREYSINHVTYWGHTEMMERIVAELQGRDWGRPVFYVSVDEPITDDMQDNLNAIGRIHWV